MYSFDQADIHLFRAFSERLGRRCRTVFLKICRGNEDPPRVLLSEATGDGVQLIELIRLDVAVLAGDKVGNHPLHEQHVDLVAGGGARIVPADHNTRTPVRKRCRIRTVPVVECRHVRFVFEQRPRLCQTVAHIRILERAGFLISIVRDGHGACFHKRAEKSVVHASVLFQPKRGLFFIQLPQRVG